MNARTVLGFLAVMCLGGAAEGPREWNNLGAERYAARDYAGAEKHYQRALAGWRKSSDPRAEARTMSNLAVLYRAQGRYREAEKFYRDALGLLDRRRFGASPEAVTTLNNLAELYRYRGEAARGEPYARQSIALAERLFGAGSPAAADGLHTLAAISSDQGRSEDALALFGRARALLEGPGVPAGTRLATNLANTAEIRMAQSDYGEAESLSRRALDAAGSDIRTRVHCLNNLAQALRLQRRYAEAEPLYREALADLGDDADSGRVLANFAGFYHDQERESRAVELYRRAVTVLEASLGPEHPETALVRTRLAEVRRAQGHFTESIALYRQAVPLLERVYGARDPRVRDAVHQFQRAASEAKRHTISAR